MNDNLTIHKTPLNHRQIDMNYLYIFAIGLFSCLFLISNPGYFSHDELQKLDHVIQYGYVDYFKHYASIQAGPHFGFPVRPIPFLIQGVQAYFMNDYPVVVHLLDVVFHCINACLFYYLLTLFKCDKKLAFLAAILFVVNPVTMQAVGWSAALMDRWYTTFGLIAFIGAFRFINYGKLVDLFLVFLGASFAILSKETAIVLPSLLLIFLLLDWKRNIYNYRFYLATFAWVLPIALYLIMRTSAIIASFSASEGAGSYSAALDNLYLNVLVYLSFPFLIDAKDILEWPLYSKSILYFCAFIHVLILLALLFKGGIKKSILYIAGYIVFISPVLLISNQGSHYLYASAFSLSLALAYLIYSGNLIVKLFSYSLCLILVIHSIFIQNNLYRVGVCESRIDISLKAQHMNAPPSKDIYFQSLPGAVNYEPVLMRYIFGRNRIDQTFGFNFIYLGTGEEVIDSNATHYLMTDSCILVKSVE